MGATVGTGKPCSYTGRAMVGKENDAKALFLRALWSASVILEGMKYVAAPVLALFFFVALPFVMLACGENLTDYRTANDAADGNATDGNSVDGNVANGNVVNDSNTAVPAASPNASSGNSNNTPATKRCSTPTTPVTYTNTTKALINQHCQSCHASRNPVMNTFAKAQTAFRDGGGQDLVQSGDMPRNETLSDAIKCQFEAWGDNHYAN